MYVFELTTIPSFKKTETMRKLGMLAQFNFLFMYFIRIPSRFRSYLNLAEITYLRCKQNIHTTLPLN